MDETSLTEPFTQMIEAVSTPQAVRAAGQGSGLGSLWQAIDKSGFIDALVPESAGGFGLAMHDAAPLLEIAGRNALPVPLGQTMAARALLAKAGKTWPDGPIVLATAQGGLARHVPLARQAAYALVETKQGASLVALGLDSLRGDSADANEAADIILDRAEVIETIAALPGSLRTLEVVLHSADIAGAADRLLDMTAAYAGTRSQFGKPIGKLQAVQQQLAVMAEKTVLARMAARLGCDCALIPTPAKAAAAKCVASAAASEITAIAHAVHGAIGISEECDVQLYTRRLQWLRLAGGSETYWARRLGEMRLADGAPGSLGFILDHLSPAVLLAYREYQT